jgi:ATP-dependent Clp protease ATP-binding subunit ClpA
VEEVMNSVKSTFRPELVNRLDEIIVFNGLSPENMKGSVEIQLCELADRLAEKKISINFGENLKKRLCEMGYDPLYGARPLKRLIQKELYDLIARKIIAGELTEGIKVFMDYQNETVRITS